MRLPVDIGDPRAEALKSGSLTFSGPRQFYAPPPILLCPNLPDEAATQTFKIRIPVPDSRCRVKLTVALFSTGQVQDDISNAGTIWVAAYEEDQKGVSGSSGKLVPVTNVEGTEAAPTNFPVSAGLQGYSREFVTAADWLGADILIQGNQNKAGFWVVQTRIQPDAVTLEWQEWEEIRRLFSPQRIA